MIVQAFTFIHSFMSALIAAKLYYRAPSDPSFHICVDSSQTVLEHHRSFAPCIHNCVDVIHLIQVFSHPKSFQSHWQHIYQPQVAIEIDDHGPDGNRAISKSGNQLTSGEFVNGSDRNRELAYIEFQIAQLQLFIALCKASSYSETSLFYRCMLLGLPNLSFQGVSFINLFPWDDLVMIMARRNSIIQLLSSN